MSTFNLPFVQFPDSYMLHAIESEGEVRGGGHEASEWAGENGRVSGSIECSYCSSNYSLNWQNSRASVAFMRCRPHTHTSSGTHAVTGRTFTHCALGSRLGDVTFVSANYYRCDRHLRTRGGTTILQTQLTIKIIINPTQWINCSRKKSLSSSPSATSFIRIFRAIVWQFTYVWFKYLLISLEPHTCVCRIATMPNEHIKLKVKCLSACLRKNTQFAMTL